MPSNINDLIAANNGGVANIKVAHDALGVGSGGDSWYNFYSAAVGHSGSLADLMYEYWTAPSGITIATPWRIEIVPFSWWSGSVGTAPVRSLVGTTVVMGGLVYDTTGVQNDEISWKVSLGAGTWDISFLHKAATNGGIVTTYLDSTSVGTVDMYGANTFNNVTTLSGVVVGTSGIYSLRLRTEAKNVSSSAYFYAPQHITLRRTA